MHNKNNNLTYLDYTVTGMAMNLESKTEDDLKPFDHKYLPLEYMKDRRWREMTIVIRSEVNPLKLIGYWHIYLKEGVTL